MKIKKICFISHSPPNELGGVSLYYKNLLHNLIKNKNLNITWIYFGIKDRKYSKDGLNYIELKKSIFKIPYFENNYKVKNCLKSNPFKIVFTTGGPWTYFYSKPFYQKLFHIYHGTVFYFNLNHFKRFSPIKKFLFSPLLLLSWISERPSKKVDKIICVSNKVKRQVENIYGKQNIKVIRTGVNLHEFKPRKSKVKNLRGLFIGKGNYYTKGLDRAVKLSREIYKLNNNYRLIIIGPDKSKVKHLINENFIEFLEDVPRDEMKYYYNKAKIFFCSSRYEGGAPTLVTSEAMASGCLTTCSEDSRQEIIKDNVNGLIISNFDKDDAKRILNNIGNKNIIKNSLKTIQKLSLDKWANKYLKQIL